MIDGENLAYWMRHPLDDLMVRVLQRVERGTQVFHHDRLQVAYLVALDCVEADLDACTLAITDKGREALEVFADHDLRRRRRR